MLLYKWIKRDSFMNQKFGRYLWYAIGEILLVVVGIIIALQIDTWYENKQSQERLDNYLDNIARNIDEDIRRVQQLKSVRAETIFESFSTSVATTHDDYGNTSWYNESLAASASAALEKSQKKLYLVANSGSYQALEASGLISELSNPAIEPMLYDYYQTIDRIANTEQDLNNVVRQLTLRFQTETAKDMPQLFLREPLLLWGEHNSNDLEEVEAFRQGYWEILTDSVTHSLLRSTMNQSIMKEYEHLLSLGQQLVNKIDYELRRETASQVAAHIYSPDSPIGHPVLIEAGRPGYHSFGVFTAPSPSSFEAVYNNIWIKDDALNVRYAGGLPWAYLYIKYGVIDIRVERIANDYSMYDRIRLELKRNVNTECSALRLEIKDIDDAEKGGLQSVPLALTPEWHTYTYDLDEFVEADLTRLNIAAGFLFESPSPCSISIRDVRYLRPK